MPNQNTSIRRIVAGHNQLERAVVLMDGAAPNQKVRPEGNISTLIWGTDEAPAEVWTGEDFGLRESSIAPNADGSWFRIVEFPPGAPGMMHRTETLDYAICISGEIDMELDDGVNVKMRPHDILVQQGTIHSWINKGSQPCRMAFVLIGAKIPKDDNLIGPGVQKLTPIEPYTKNEKPPLPPIRRIVTTHDPAGKAIIMNDGLAPQRQLRARGNVSTLIWGSDETPAEICSAEDFGLRENDIEPPQRGSWCRVIDYPPGLPGRMHRTDSIDYVVCLSGKIDMELDDGAKTRMHAGDVMVQQANNHSWVNTGTEPCRIVFVLLGSKRND